MLDHHHAPSHSGVADPLRAAQGMSLVLTRRALLACGAVLGTQDEPPSASPWFDNALEWPDGQLDAYRPLDEGSDVAEIEVRLKLRQRHLQLLEQAAALARGGLMGLREVLSGMSLNVGRRKWRRRRAKVRERYAEQDPWCVQCQRPMRICTQPAGNPRWNFSGFQCLRSENSNPPGIFPVPDDTRLYGITNTAHSTPIGESEEI